MKTIIAGLLIRPHQRQPYRSESRTVQIRLSGHWLERLGFQPGQPVYIYPTENGITLSPCPPVQVTELTDLDQLKAEFIRLGIPTTRNRHE